MKKDFNELLKGFVIYNNKEIKMTDETNGYEYYHILIASDDKNYYYLYDYRDEDIERGELIMKDEYLKIDKLSKIKPNKKLTFNRIVNSTIKRIIITKETEDDEINVFNSDKKEDMIELYKRMILKFVLKKKINLYDGITLKPFVPEPEPDEEKREPKAFIFPPDIRTLSLKSKKGTYSNQYYFLLAKTNKNYYYLTPPIGKDNNKDVILYDSDLSISRISNNNDSTEYHIVYIEDWNEDDNNYLKVFRGEEEDKGDLLFESKNKKDQLNFLIRFFKNRYLKEKIDIYPEYTEYLNKKVEPKKEEQNPNIELIIKEKPNKLISINEAKKYINMETQTNEDELKEIIKTLRAENQQLKDELNKLKEAKEQKEPEKEKKPVIKREPKPIIKGEVEDFTHNNITYKKSKLPFRQTEKYYLWDKDSGHLVGIYNAITNRINSVPKHLKEAKIIQGGGIKDQEEDDEEEEPINEDIDWINKKITYGKGIKRRTTDFLIQSVIFDKSLYNNNTATKWLKEHKFQNNGVDVKPNTLRYRQIDPQIVKQAGYKNYHNKILGNSGIELVLVYKGVQKQGGGVSNWINYVKKYAKKHNITYAQALKDPKLKQNYKN